MWSYQPHHVIFITHIILYHTTLVTPLWYRGKVWMYHLTILFLWSKGAAAITLQCIHVLPSRTTILLDKIRKWLSRRYKTMKLKEWTIMTRMKPFRMVTLRHKMTMKTLSSPNLMKSVTSMRLVWRLGKMLTRNMHSTRRPVTVYRLTELSQIPDIICKITWSTAVGVPHLDFNIDCSFTRGHICMTVPPSHTHPFSHGCSTLYFCEGSADCKPL